MGEIGHSRFQQGHLDPLEHGRDNFGSLACPKIFHSHTSVPEKGSQLGANGSLCKSNGAKEVSYVGGAKIITRGPWLCMGDFNCTLREGERGTEGGISGSFVKWKEDSDLIDLGFLALDLHGITSLTPYPKNNKVG